MFVYVISEIEIAGCYGYLQTFIGLIQLYKQKRVFIISFREYERILFLLNLRHIGCILVILLFFDHITLLLYALVL